MTPEDIAQITAIVGASEERLNARMSQTEERLNARMSQTEERLNARIEHLTVGIAAVEERLNARIERVETSLLTEFHKWASPAEARAKSHAAVLRALDAEMEYLSDRVTKLEGKPPQ